MKGKQEGKIRKQQENSIIYSIPSLSILYFSKATEDHIKKHSIKHIYNIQIKKYIFFVEGTSKCLYLYFMIR